MTEQLGALDPYDLAPPPAPKPETLPILFQDDDYVAVHKPPGLLVHRSELAREADTAALQIVRDQIGMHLFPVHRLDRPTSGVLIFALSKEAAQAFVDGLTHKTVEKEYWAIARGWIHDAVDLDSALDKNQVYPPSNKNHLEPKLQEAITQFRPGLTCELNIPVRPYDTARYSLVKASPKTGRTHQIRRHLARLRHPIIGDTRYGDGPHNLMYRERFKCYRLLLAAVSLDFTHPRTGSKTRIFAEPSEDFGEVAQQLFGSDVYKKFCRQLS